MVRRVVQKITQVRAEYASARLICASLEHRVAGTRRQAYPGYLPAEIDYRTEDGSPCTISIRDYDVRFLDRVASAEAVEHVNLVHQARHGNLSAREELHRRTAALLPKIAARFAGGTLTENEYVIPYTSSREYTEVEISNKGANLLDLSRRGFATSDFTLLAGSAYVLPAAKRVQCVDDAIANLSKLSGRKLGDPENPLLVAMRSAMPEYIPGYMPTWLNVGYTPDMQRGLPARYGEEAAARIRLNNRKTILEALDPGAYAALEAELRPDLGLVENQDLAARIEELIRREDERLLVSPHAQILFFLRKTYEYYASHLDTLRNFMGRSVHYPSIIFQRMVCSVLDEQSHVGVLYSRHPRTGTGVHLQYARTVYGEELMTGRLRPTEVTFESAEEARESFPAVYHFWRRLAQLEEIFRSPVMVEFTGVHGTFTLLQVNEAELSGVGMLTAVMDLHRAGKINAERVRALIKPYHVRQIESDAIDPKSLISLAPFGRGFSVLPRSAVSGRIFFSGTRARQARVERGGEKVILAKPRFTPHDAISMQAVHGILSLSPAAIHVVTTAQTLGIPALLNLEEDGVRIDEERREMVNRDGEVVREDDWVTISSRNRTLFTGRAVFAPARLLRYMAGEKVPLTPDEEEPFAKWAAYLREYRLILENVEAAEFTSLMDLGHAIRYGKLRDDPVKAASFVNRCFDANEEQLTRRLLDATLGHHLVHTTPYEMLSPDRQVRLIAAALTLCREKGLSGYQAGAFVLGGFITPKCRASFWRSFSPVEIAMLVNEWLLHRKYLMVLDDVGERRVSRAKESILSRGLGTLRLDRGLLAELMTLKLSGVNLAAVLASIPPGADPQTIEVLERLGEPYGAFYDYADPWSIAPLRDLCDAEGLPLPAPDDR